MRVRKEVQAVIWDRVNGKLKFLLVKKIDRKFFNYKWRLLKGGVEDKETDKMAMLREIYEEVGLKNVVFGEKIHSYDFVFEDTVHSVAAYLVKADSKENIHVDTRENANAEWMDGEQVMKAIFWEHEKNSLEKSFKILDATQPLR